MVKLVALFFVFTGLFFSSLAIGENDDVSKLSFPILPTWYTLRGIDDTEIEFYRFRRYTDSGGFFDNAIVLTCWKDNSNPEFEIIPPRFLREAWTKHTGSTSENRKAEIERQDGSRFIFERGAKIDNVAAFVDAATTDELYKILEIFDEPKFQITFDGIPIHQKYVGGKLYVLHETKNQFQIDAVKYTWQDAYSTCRKVSE